MLIHIINKLAKKLKKKNKIVDQIAIYNSKYQEKYIKIIFLKIDYFYLIIVFKLFLIS